MYIASYGFHLHDFYSPQALEESCSSPIHDYVLEESDVLAPPVVILDLDIKTVQIADLEVEMCCLTVHMSMFIVLF